MKKAVFFDRDGTLIEDKVYLNDPDNIIYLPGVFDCLAQIQNQGFTIIVVTNQSGIPRGLVDVKNLHLIHEKMDKEFKKHGVSIATFLYAPYMVETNHFYRKPNPGMLLDGALRNEILLKESWMVGDRMTDVEAGHRAGTRSILLGDLEDPQGFEYEPPEAHVHSLLEVANFIVNSTIKN